MLAKMTLAKLTYLGLGNAALQIFIFAHQTCSERNAEEGHVFVWGFGILGKGPKLMEAAVPEMIPPTLFGFSDFSPDIRVAQIRCGLNQFAAINSEFLNCCFTLGSLGEEGVAFHGQSCLDGTERSATFGLLKVSAMEISCLPSRKGKSQTKIQKQKTLQISSKRRKSVCFEERSGVLGEAWMLWAWLETEGSEKDSSLQPLVLESNNMEPNMGLFKREIFK